MKRSNVNDEVHHHAVEYESIRSHYEGLLTEKEGRWQRQLITLETDCKQQLVSVKREAGEQLIAIKKEAGEQLLLTQHKATRERDSLDLITQAKLAAKEESTRSEWEKKLKKVEKQLLTANKLYSDRY